MLAASGIAIFSGPFDLVWGEFTILSHGPGWGWIQCSCTELFFLDLIDQENVRYESGQPEAVCPGCGRCQRD